GSANQLVATRHVHKCAAGRCAQGGRRQRGGESPLSDAPKQQRRSAVIQDQPVVKGAGWLTVVSRGPAGKLPTVEDRPGGGGGARRPRRAGFGPRGGGAAPPPRLQKHFAIEVRRNPPRNDLGQVRLLGTEVPLCPAEEPQRPQRRGGTGDGNANSRWEIL